MKNINSIENNKNLTVINLFGGPGSGKSSTAGGLFHQMKYAGYDVELVTEFAKDMVYQKRHSVFSEQDYIFAKQHHRQRRLVQSGTKFCITDSPLLLSNLYVPSDYYKFFLAFANEAFKTFNNINVFIRRVKTYNPIGRYQTEDEAKEIDFKNLLLFFNVNEPFYIIDGNKNASEQILNLVNSLKQPGDHALPEGITYVKPINFQEQGATEQRYAFFIWFENNCQGNMIDFYPSNSK